MPLLLFEKNEKESRLVSNLSLPPSTTPFPLFVSKGRGFRGAIPLLRFPRALGRLERKRGKGREKKKGKEGRATASARTKPSSASPSCVYITRLCRRLKIGEKSDLSLSLWNRRCSAFRGALARFLNHSASSEGKNFSRNLGKRPVFVFDEDTIFEMWGRREEGEELEKEIARLVVVSHQNKRDDRQKRVHTHTHGA